MRLPILKVGNPILHAIAEEVTKEDIPDILSTISDLTETMRSTELVGIAAPQVGISKRFFITETQERQPDGEKKKVLRVYINPKITSFSESTREDYEGCGSVPSIFGIVKRSKKITIEYLDTAGVSQRLIADGFLARVIQHEYDHLDGITFIERISEPKTIIEKGELYAKYEREKTTRDLEGTATKE